MNLLRRVSRPLMAGIYVFGGINQLREPSSKYGAAQPVAPQLAKAVNDSPVPVTLPTETEQLVKLNGAIMVGAGTLLGLNKFPRLSAAVLAASLLPTTAAGHRWWEAEGEREKTQQQVHMLKNLSMLGGLLLTVGDQGSRASVPQMGGRALRRARREAVLAGRQASLSGELQAARARRSIESAPRKVTKAATKAAKKAA